MQKRQGNKLSGQKKKKNLTSQLTNLFFGMSFPCSSNGDGEGEGDGEEDEEELPSKKTGVAMNTPPPSLVPPASLTRS